MTVDELIDTLHQAKLSGELQGTDPVFTSQGKHGFLPPNLNIRTKNCVLEKHGVNDEYLNLGFMSEDAQAQVLKMWNDKKRFKRIDRAVTL
jgi:hypothetical protein